METLDLSHCSITDIGALQCGNLYNLSLTDTLVSDLGPLGKCGNLRVLDLDGCFIKDIGPLRKCPNLSSVSLVSCHELTDVSVLGLCNNLQVVRYSSCCNFSCWTLNPSIITIVVECRDVHCRDFSDPDSDWTF